MASLAWIRSSSASAQLGRRLAGRTNNLLECPLVLAGGSCPSFSITSNNYHRQHQRRHYIPMTAEEEEEEKKRVAGLTEFQKDQELRKLNREIARLEKQRGINTGELYTWSGQYKALARDYGMPLFAWYWACWISTAVLCYGAITVFDIDTMALLAKVDNLTGFSLVDKVDPRLGKIGMAIIANEAIEPVRLPFVIVTLKPVVDRIAPPKY